MKPSILFLATAALVAPIAAQGEGPGTDLIDLYEKSQRDGATDDELIQMLENKALIDPLEFRELTPEELQHEKDAVFDGLRRLKGKADPEPAGRPKENATPRPMRDGPPPGKIPHAPRWLVGLVVNSLDPSLRSHFDLPEGAGVVVESVMRGSPAAKAGIKTNDLIVTADERKVASLEDLRAAVEKAGNEGKAMKLEVIHRGKRSTVEVKPRGRQPLEDKGRKAAPGPELRPMIEVQRRLDQQQKEIEKLRREVERLRESLKRE